MFNQVSAGGFHTCGILKTVNTVVCWGDNSLLQVTPPPGAFTQVSAGFWYTCGLKTGGTLVCWGDNYYGQATPPVGTFTQVSAGNSDPTFACAVERDASVACWGVVAIAQTPTLLP